MSEILYGEEAQEKLLEGVNLVANTIKGTLGPKARTVIIKKNGRPVVINDGVTIARRLNLMMSLFRLVLNYYNKLHQKHRKIQVMEQLLLLS